MIWIVSIFRKYGLSPRISSTNILRCLPRINGEDIPIEIWYIASFIVKKCMLGTTSPFGALTVMQPVNLSTLSPSLSFELSSFKFNGCSCGAGSGAGAGAEAIHVRVKKQVFFIKK